MNKINFSNLPSTTTPLNATNLNQLQTNIDNAKVEKTTTLSAPDDLNNYKTTGTWIADSSIGNIPIASTGVWYIEVIRYSGNYVLQRATREQPTPDAMSMYIRQFTGGNNWSNWKDISAPITTSNANGTATKFPDGTMICRKTINKSSFLSESDPSNSSQGISIHRSNIAEWTFPEQFINTDIQIQVTPKSATSGLRMYIPAVLSLAQTTTQIQLMSMDAFTSSASAYTNLSEVYVTAIGRWK